MPAGVGYGPYPPPRSLEPQQVGMMLQQGLIDGGGGMQSMARIPEPAEAQQMVTERPELQTRDDDFDPSVEHSPSSTAAAVGDYLRRTSAGGPPGPGQHPRPATIFQEQQWEAVGLTPAEIALMRKAAAIK